MKTFEYWRYMAKKYGFSKDYSTGNGWIIDSHWPTCVYGLNTTRRIYVLENEKNNIYVKHYRIQLGD